MVVLGFDVVPVFSSVARHSEGPEGVLLRLGHYKLRGEHTHDDCDVVRSRSKTFVWSLTRISLILKLASAFTFQPGTEEQ